MSRIFASVAQKMKNRDKTKVVNAWKFMVAEKVAQRNRMKKVIGRIKNMACAAAMSTWIAMVMEVKRM